MRKYKIGVIQCNTQNDKGKNLDWIETCIDEAAAQGVQLITLPETMHCMGDNVGEGGNRREDIPGYTIRRMAAKAKQHHIYIHCGSICEDRPGEKLYYNTSIVLDREGEIIGKYRKLHTFDVTLPNGEERRESDRVLAGKEIVTVETDLGVLGLSVCYDLRFPELYRIMALKGAQILLVPANFTMLTGKDHWEVLLRARAIENGCYVIAPDQLGTKPNGGTSYANSLVVDPWGTVIAKAPDKTGWFSAEIDLDYLDDVRRRMPGLKNRRKDVYVCAETDEVAE